MCGYFFTVPQFAYNLLREYIFLVCQWCDKQQKKKINVKNGKDILCLFNQNSIFIFLLR
jgi:hypothetical protein